MPAGAAAIAAGKQGRGWNFIELFYRNQGLETSGYVTDEFLTAIARGAGVPDIAQVEQRPQEQARCSARSRATTEEAEELGFTGTPSFAVEGPATAGHRSPRHARLGGGARRSDRRRGLRRGNAFSGRRITSS